MLTKSDYVGILKYYKMDIPITKANLKKTANKIMNDKLCKCIKKLDPVNEAKSIGICTRTIFNNKGFTRGAFQCKTKRFVNYRRTNANKRGTKTRTTKNKRGTKKRTKTQKRRNK